MRARHAHPDALSVQAKLTALNLPFMRENYQPLANTAADSTGRTSTTSPSCSQAKPPHAKTAASSAASSRPASQS